MIKVFHCADIHLDSPFAMLSPREAAKRRTELRAAFTSALMLAQKAKMDIFLISGDLFDSEYVTRDTREMLLREFAKTPEMRIFIAPGNHDPITAGSFYETAEFPKNVHVFKGERECVHIPELNADIYGFGFTSKNYLSSPVAGWQIQNKDRINILVCHGDNTSASSVTGPVTKKDIAESGFDYIALGHIHKASGLQCENGVYYSYPGCIEGRSFDELGYKGAMYGIIEKGNVNMQAVRLSKSRYEIATVDISDAADKSRAIEIIRNEIRQFTDDTALRLILTGETETPMLISPNEIGSGCEYPFFIEITDKTYLKPNLTQLEQSNTLKGVFCRKMAELIAQAPPDTEEYRVLTLALKYGISALEDRNVIDYGGND